MGFNSGFKGLNIAGELPLEHNDQTCWCF